MNAPTNTAIEKAAGQHRDTAEAMLEFIDQEDIIESVEDYEAAPAVIAQLKVKREALDRQRREWVDPLNAVIKSINAAFKPATEFYDKAESMLKDRLADFRSDRERLRMEALARVEKAQSGERESLMVQASNAEIPKLKGVSYRESWTGEVTDAEAIVAFFVNTGQLQYLLPNVKALKAVTKAMEGKTTIPGWATHKSTTVAISKALAK